jgi:hypothetical protein
VLKAVKIKVRLDRQQFCFFQGRENITLGNV